MRYQSFTLFHNQLKTSYPNHLARFYLILSVDEYERRKGMELVFSLLPKEVRRIFRKEFPFEELAKELSSMDLFSSKGIIAADFDKELKKKEADVLLSLLLKFPGFFLMGASSLSLSSLYRFMEKEGVVLDLLDEKKWEKEKRLKEAVWEKVRQVKKAISQEALDELFIRIPLDLALLHSEVDKLLCYIGEKKQIAKTDVEEIISFSLSYSAWQAAEKIVWGICSISDIHSIEPSLLFSALRMELKNGLILKDLMSRGASTQEIAKCFPGMWPKALERKKEMVHAVPLSYFKRGLMILFEKELLSRNGLDSLDLIDCFICLLKAVR